MVDQFFGKWNFLQSENFEEYLKQVGVGLLTRKMANNLKPQIVFEKSGNGVKMSSLSTFKNITVEFELDKQIEETTGDGRKCMSTFSLKDNKLVQEQKPVNSVEKSSHFERWIEGNKLFITGESEGVKFKRIYEKADK
uniref:Cytosolic fatty-acid binding proteins domain-containing protein n=1 Tax=Panagrolaimus sp. JU765 TaxID=591449 RepID=A0AC34RJG7_9BILA